MVDGVDGKGIRALSQHCSKRIDTIRKIERGFVMSIVRAHRSGAIDAAAAGCTTIVIAHRLSTVRNTDTIAFVHEGQVIESGTHDELLANHNSRYSSLASLNKNTADVNMNHSSILSPVTGQSFSSTPNARSFSEGESAFDNGEQDLECKKVRQARPSFLRLLMLNAPEWPQAVLGFTGCLLVGAVQPLYGYLMGSIVPIYFLKDHEEMMKKLSRYSMFMIALAIYSFLANVLQHYNLAAMGEYLTKRVRERMLSKVLTFELGWFDQAENSSGAICSKLAKDASVVRSLVGDRMGLIIQAISAVTISLTMGLLLAWRLAAVIISMHPVRILSMYAKIVLLKKFSKMALKAQSESSKVAAEAINNHRTVTAFSSQNRILQHFELTQAAPRQEGIRQSWLAGIGLGLSQCISHSSAGLAFWYGGYLVLHGQITSRDCFRVLSIVLGTASVVADACAMTSDLTKGAETVASVIDIFDRATNIEPNGQNDLQEKSIYGDIVFSKVNFAYPTRTDVTVLRSFTLAIKAGRSTALVGPSGSGKSTIIGLIERFYDPIAGEVRIDGRNIKTYNLRSLRRHIALVGQEPALLGSTVRECITYGAEVGVTDAEVEAAARAANAHGFISGLTNGYHTSLGERGAQLSGGQKQRIAIARAIVRNPAILLLDEATSALDGKSEKVVQEALERVMVGRTTMLVAHRLSTVRKCDRIAVLEQGVVVEKGKHASLMAMGSTGKYYNLVSLQTAETNISNQ
ncbi:hypothetical protein HPP92_004309 [Vanilla planifolia]|uniref:Uncharacterized protein n=1 Tax=Vanilla planifolia TaxID=51239 RepID=A0A835VDU9_VANPL|nr:hypothetical protein HPP92_004309 [Vanilla planifolia]